MGVMRDGKMKIDEFMVNNAVDTLINAHKIMADKKLMGMAKKEMAVRQKAVNMAVKSIGKRGKR